MVEHIHGDRARVRAISSLVRAASFIKTWSSAGYSILVKSALQSNRPQGMKNYRTQTPVPERTAIMRTLTYLLRAPTLAALLFAGGIALGWQAAAHAAPQSQDTFEIIIVGQIDVAGGSDPACPVCNLSLDTQDLNFGDSMPLTQFEAVARDSTGAEVDRDTSTAAGNSLQTISLMVPEISAGDSYTVEISAAPAGWLSCFNDPTTKTVTASDFDLGRARVDYFFYVESECPGGVGVATATPPTATATPSPSGETVSLLAVGFVDVAGGSDPACPACNGELDNADDDYATTDPLPPLTIVVRGAGGAEIARGRTSALANLQQVAFEVPLPGAGASYTIELDGTPRDWLLCFNDVPRKVVRVSDFQLGSARVDFYFYKREFCPSMAGPVVPTSVPPPTGDDDDDDDDDRRSPPSTGGAAPAAPPPPPPPPPPGPAVVYELVHKGPPSPPNAGGVGEIRGPGGGTGLGQIKGMGFIDTNGNGVFEAGEPGLNDLRIILRGGGLDLSYITDGTGAFNFGTLGAGVYDVFIEPGNEWFITTPRLYKVTVEGDIVHGVNFGLIRHTDRAALGKPTYRLVESRAPKAHHGVRLPHTGIADLPTAPLLATLAAVLGALAMVGMAAERRRR